MNSASPEHEIRSALEEALSRHFQARRRIVRIRRRRSRYSSSTSIENVDLQLDRGKPMRVVFKDLSRGALLQTAREVRPRFLYHPLREIETYRRILGPLHLGTARFYGAFSCSNSERYWLFLERVPGPLLWQVGALETWKDAARWLARLHSDFAEVKLTVRQLRAAHLVNYDRTLLQRWLARAQQFLRHSRTFESQALRESFEQLACNYGCVIDRLLALPRTFIHGEFYPSNVIVRNGRHGKGVCPIDWEVAGIGPALMDLAALTSGNWGRDQVVAMASAYKAAVVPRRGWPPPLPELMEGICYCQLQLAIQWLGWAADWAPPKIHAQSWLGEALRLARELGIVENGVSPSATARPGPLPKP